nr:MAG TPA: Stomagen [Bacteriophage sp.]
MSKSCGCLKREKAKQKNQVKAQEHIDEKYGKLTIINYKLKDENYWYKCKCECGNNI